LRIPNRVTIPLSRLVSAAMACIFQNAQTLARLCVGRAATVLKSREEKRWGGMNREGNPQGPLRGVIKAPPGGLPWRRYRSVRSQQSSPQESMGEACHKSTAIRQQKRDVARAKAPQLKPWE
jgi:hypothetical protein